MLSLDQTISLLAPAAAAILDADAAALRQVQARRDEIVLWDPQPAAAAVATQRRAAVATAMRTRIGPRHGWVLRTEYLASGGYEWEIGPGVVLRLSKTTRESRQDAALAAMGVQIPLWEVERAGDGTEDVLLVRLNGNATARATIDVAHINARGKVIFRVSMSTIARSAVDTMIATGAPRPSVKLPGDKQQRKTSQG